MECAAKNNESVNATCVKETRGVPKILSVPIKLNNEAIKVKVENLVNLALDSALNTLYLDFFIKKKGRIG
jgi:hypothetical protein